MAKHEERAAKISAPPTEREVADFFRILEKHGLEELNRRRDQYQKPKRKRGRLRNEFFNDFSVSELPWKGLYMVRFKIGGAAPLVCAIVRPRKHRLKPGDPFKTWV